MMIRTRIIHFIFSCSTALKCWLNNDLIQDVKSVERMYMMGVSWTCLDYRLQLIGAEADITENSHRNSRILIAYNRLTNISRNN